MNNIRKLIDDLKSWASGGDSISSTVEARIPTTDLLKDYEEHAVESSLEPLVIETKLSDYGIEGCVQDIHKGPMITRYDIKLARGVRVSQVKKISEDLEIALMSGKVIIQAPIPGTDSIGIQVANDDISTVGLKGIIEAVQLSNMELPIGIGVDILGKPQVVDLAKLPHLLIAGQTGSGKSVGLNSILMSILFTKTPEECQLVIVDPKRVEMSAYQGIPHLLRPVVTDSDEAVEVFGELVTEMENRYRILAGARVKNIVSYNAISNERMPYIVAVVDEMADLMMTSSKQIEPHIVRLAQLARAVGIHLVMATQKPIVKVITGLIKSNMPSRISYQVASGCDSRVILDSNGAEKLLGRGDLLMTYPGASEPVRFHGAWVSEQEVERVCNYIKGE